MTAHLALGTAQFGMDYGIANQTGRPGVSEVAEILQLAREADVNMLDTAIAYGQSETVLGQLGVADWRVVSKLPEVPDHVRDIDGWMLAQVEGSLTRLGIDQLYGLILHNPTQMHGARAPQIAGALEDVSARGLAKRVGVSIQNPDHDLPAVLRHMQPGLLQAPFNVLQDDLVRQGWAARLRAMDCEVHARSVFLQGLLLMPPETRPSSFARWNVFWHEWQHWLDDHDLTPTEACLRFVRSQSDIDYCIVGVDSAAQLRELLEVGSEPLETLPDWPGAADQELINPSRWAIQ